jgi:hypothetical protein
MPGQRKAPDHRKRVAVEPQDVDVAVDKISHVEIAPVWTESGPFGEATDIELSYVAYGFSFDLQQRHVGVLMPVKGRLGRAAGAV